MLFVELFESGFQLVIQLLIIEFGRDVVQPFAEPVPNLGINAAAGVMVDIVGKLLAKLVVRHLIVRHPDDGKIAREEIDFRQVVERGNQLAAGEVASRAKDNHNAGIGGTTRNGRSPREHFSLGHSILLVRTVAAGFGPTSGRMGRPLRAYHADFFSITGSRCPPNFCRIAESIFSANVCSSRERKRTNTSAESTSTGTASSMAASIVQRPSPESWTYPEYSASVGFSARAMAVKSSSQELITLPRRQTSAMSAKFRSYCWSFGKSGLLALRKMSKPSA